MLTVATVHGPSCGIADWVAVGAFDSVRDTVTLGVTGGDRVIVTGALGEWEATLVGGGEGVRVGHVAPAGHAYTHV